ncbi:MAG: hypothetical protein GVY11_01280, partial [Gammaproteobacteria bacterium]|nr:hypothetical protein [Gammaproteobacteria bacterium]
MATFNATFVRRLSQSNLGAHVEIPAGNGAVGPAALTTSGTAQRLQRGGSDWTADGEGFLVMTCDGA